MRLTRFFLTALLLGLNLIASTTFAQLVKRQWKVIQSQPQAEIWRYEEANGRIAITSVQNVFVITFTGKFTRHNYPYTTLTKQNSGAMSYSGPNPNNIDAKAIQIRGWQIEVKNAAEPLRVFCFEASQFPISKWVGELLVQSGSTKTMGNELLPRKTVTVRLGDWLSTIAQDHLGNKMDWFRLWAWNAKVVGKNPNLIFPDSALTLPPNSSIWRVEPTDTTIWKSGWAIEFVHENDSLLARVSVGFRRGDLIFALNSNEKRIGRISSRFVDRNGRQGSSVEFRVPPGLPSYIPVGKF